MRNTFFTACAATVLCACPVALAQDECATAPTLVTGVGSPFNTATATVTATPVVTDALCAASFLNWSVTQKDVWFKWLATAAGTADFSTCFAGSYDTSIVIYSGTCGTLTPVACNGDGPTNAGCQNFYSLVSQLPVTAGTTYYVRIGGYTDPADATDQGATGAGQITVTFTEGVAGCAGATGACDAVHVTPGCATSSCCAAVCNFLPDCCVVTWDQSCVDTVYTTCTGFFLYTCQNPVPANDCATSPLLITGDSVVPFNNVNANNDGPGFGDVCAGGQSGNNESNHDVWFRLNAIANGSFSMDTCGQMTFDSKVAVYDLGTSPNTFNYNQLPLALVDCNDDGPADCGLGSKLSVTVQSGHSYLVCLAGFEQTDQGVGTITFNVPEPCALPSATSAEGEPCGQNLNGGCNSTPPAFEPVLVGATVEGSFYMTPAVGTTAATRDTDWYQFSIPADRTVTVELRAAALATAFILGSDCPAVVLATGTGSCPNTASICLSAGTYNIAVVPNFVDAPVPCSNNVLNKYTMRLTAVVPTTPCPALVATTCANPGPNNYSSQSNQATTAGVVACGVNPAFPACSGGGTTANSYARVIPAASAFDSINCLGIGFFSVKRAANTAGTACANFASDIPLPATIGIYRDINDGAPTKAFLPDGTCPTGDCDLQLITYKNVLVPGGAYIGQVEFDPPLCLDQETHNIVVVMDCPDLYAGTAGVPAASGYGIRPSGASVTGQSSNTYCRLSCSDAAGQYVLTESLGATFTAQWVVNVNGQATGCGAASCVGDMNNDRVVNGADLGLLLGAWGSCPGCIQDINQDAVVNGADLGLLLGAWGPCP